MARLLKGAALASLAGLAVSAALYRLTRAGAAFSLAITCGVFAYHLWMRLAVGGAFNILLGNRADPNARWFRPRPWEARLYRRLRVGRWKAKLPTYEPTHFDPKRYSWEEIAQAMCQAELVHETIALLSLLPIAAIPLFGSPSAFLITSLLSAAFDLAFAIAQRYNRPVVVRLAERLRRRATQQEESEHRPNQPGAQRGYAADKKEGPSGPTSGSRFRSVSGGDRPA